MNRGSTNFNISDKQPVSREMSGHLPVNYFLFARRVTRLEQGKIKKEDSIEQKVQGLFHQTAHYYIAPFYKAIANVLY